MPNFLERLQQTIDRLKLLTDIQIETSRTRLTVNLMNAMIYAAVDNTAPATCVKAVSEDAGTQVLRKIKAIMASITLRATVANISKCFYSAAGGGVIYCFVALNKIHIASLVWRIYYCILAGLNYGLGFMLIHMLYLHCCWEVAHEKRTKTQAA